MPNTLTKQERQRARRAKPFELAIQRWMLKRARAEAAKQIKAIRQSKGKWVVSKSVVSKAATVDKELLEILMRFGVAQANDAALNVTDISGITRIINPRSLQRELQSADFRLKVFTVLKKWATLHVKKIDAETADMVSRSIKDILIEASGEVPLPSPGEMARRIRTQFHGRDPSKRLYAWSPERAALITRTELNMAHGVGTHNSYKLVDKISEGTPWMPRKRWLAKDDGRSGDRHHELMNNVTVDIDEDFVLPDGTLMQHPGDPSAPIKHLANCRCAERAVMVKRTDKDMPARTRGL